MTAARAATRRAAILLTALVVLLLGAPAALAHSELARSDPPDRGLVAVGRTSLSLWFTEAVNGPGSTFALRTLDGAPVTARATVSGTDAGFVEITTDPLAEGTYLLEWTVLSRDDGHSSRGSIAFGAGVRPDLSLSGLGDRPSATALALRWLDLTAIMLALGAVAVTGRVLRPLGRPGAGPRRTAIMWGAAAAGVAVVTGAITPLARTYGDGLAVSSWLEATRVALLSTSWGHLWLAREAALLLAAVALGSWVARAGVRDRRFRVSAGAFLAVASWFEAAAGHAAALPERSVAATLASATHLAGAGVWVGGLAVLTLGVVPAMRRAGDPDAPSPPLVPMWRAFSSMAALTAGVVVATGLYESGRYLPGLGSVTSTSYGDALTVKVVLVAVALSFAGVNTVLVRPRAAVLVGRALGRPAGWTPVRPGRFPVVVAAEVTVLGLAVAAAAVLTSVPTARDASLTAGQPDVHSANVDGLLVTFEEVSTGSDRSRLIVRTRSTVRPEPAPVTGVTVVLIGPADGSTTVRLDPVEPGRFEAGTAALTPGAWAAVVAVERTGLPSAVTEADWTVGEPTSTAPRPLEHATTALALLLLFATVAALGVARRRDLPVDTSVLSGTTRSGR